jgi:hypothetical protein
MKITTQNITGVPLCASVLALIASKSESYLSQRLMLYEPSSKYGLTFQTCRGLFLFVKPLCPCPYDAVRSRSDRS